MGCEGEDGGVAVFECLLGWKGARILAGDVKRELPLRV